MAIRASSSWIVFTNSGTSLEWSMLCASILPSSLTASFSPITALGTIEETSCARKPSCVPASEFSIQSNLAGLSCLRRVVASQL